MARPSKYLRELRDRAVRMVMESKAEYGSDYEAIRSIASKLGITSPGLLRKWMRKAEVDGGIRPGKTGDGLAEIRELKKEVADWGDDAVAPYEQTPGSERLPWACMGSH